MDRNMLNTCESPALPADQFHIIIVGYEEKTCFAHYLWDMGTTNARIFVYRRVSPERPLRQWHGPCGMEIKERLILPNYGKDLSAFHSYVLEHYESPPLAVALIHAHGPHAYHSDCEGIVGRVRFAYRGLVSPAGLRDAAEFSNHMVTLTRVGGQQDSHPMRNELPFLQNRQSRPLSRHTRSLLGEDAHEQQVIDSCLPIYQKWGINLTADAFWSCCASFVLPWDRILRFPQGFYRDAYEHSLQEKWDVYFTSRHCWEFVVWKWYEEPPLTPRMQDLYAQAADLAAQLNLSRCANSLPDSC